MSDLELHAYQILQNLGLKPCLLKDTVDGIIKYYYEDRRFYHSYEHIIYMLDKAEEFSFNDPMLCFCILMHDVYYVPGNRKGHNELASYKMAFDIFSNCFAVEDSDINKLHSILNTAKFMEYNDKFDDISKQLSDLDLVSLAKPYDEFVKQQGRIITEVGGSLYDSAKFLNSLLESRGNKLFYNDCVIEKYEALAVRNICDFHHRLISEYSD
jgi:predicted metal-dependent HD superfamily phosphohydrolase